MLLAARRAEAPSRRHHHRRRQGEPGAVRRDRARRRQAADVEDRPLADQGQDGRDRRAAGRRDERPHLLRRQLLRLRRRALLRPCGCSTSWPAADAEPGRDARRAAAAGQHAGAPLRLPGGAQVRRRRGGQGAAGSRPAPRSTTSTACASARADGWWLLRASNTQAVLVARCEAPTRRASSGSRRDLKAALSASGVSLPDEASAGHH